MADAERRTIHQSPRTDRGIDTSFGSNAIRLSFNQWLISVLAIVVFFVLTPMAWNWMHPFSAEIDYRIPERFSHDYWLFERYSEWLADRDTIPVMGDSVVWGQYVPPVQTLSHYLNESAAHHRFGNLGVNGMHPAAMQGLIEYYGSDIRNQIVLVHCNLLWMSSKEHDLQIETEFRFNHPKLVPQFFPQIPCYKEKYSNRIGIAIERYIPFFTWASHLRITAFDNMDIPTWTIDHPYQFPYAAILDRDMNPVQDDRPNAESWTEKKIPLQNLEWVDLQTSIQWQSFQHTIEILQRRNNRLLVVLGPFNEHMLQPESLLRYSAIKAGVIQWFESHDIPILVPNLLPSDLYADASHPLAEGYANLAQIIAGSEAFAAFVNGR